MFWIPILAGAAIGAMSNKDDPLKGALLGAGIGATGGAAAGAAGIGAAGAAGTTAAGTAAGAGASGGLLAGGATEAGLLAAAPSSTASTAGLLGVPGASTGAGSQAAMLAAQNEGFGAIGQQMLAQSAGTSAPTSVNLMAGLQKAGETASGAMETAKPFMQAAQSAQQINGLLSSPDAAPPPPMPIQSQPLDLSGVLNANQQQMAQTFEEDMQRRKSLNDFARYAMGVR